MRGRRLRPGTTAALAVTLAFAPLTAVGANAEASESAPPVSARFAEADGPTVTLITGDRVRLLGEGAQGVAFQPGPGREDMGHNWFREANGEVHVVPDDVAPLIAAGTLDKRLFNVSQLIEAGYHDGARDDVPVLVSYADGDVQARSTALADGAATRVNTLSTINGEALRAKKATTTRFWHSVRPMLRQDRAIEHLWLDAPVRATLDHTVPRIGAPEAWESGFTGEGVTVAVLDTGIDADHPDLDDAVAESEDFTGGGSADDGNGHGTHVAGTIAGDGTASDGTYRGVAPDADLAVGKVLNDAGEGQESWVLAGMEWAAQRADVVNMSLGGGFSDGGDPLSQAVNRLTEETDTLFVVAAGNDGPWEGTIGSPGAADAALTVGAVDDNDELAEFSSRGPRLGDNGIKPELTAPGVDVVSARASGTEGEFYTSASGTSMATPHVAGAAALVAQARQDASAAELKSALVNSAVPNESLSSYEQGAGRVDVASAVKQRVLAEPAVVNLGTVAWPYEDADPLTRAVTYTNHGPEPVTLTLDGSLQGPEGMLTVDPKEVTVPAGGKAAVTLTVDPSVGGAGRYSGTLVATGDDGSVVRTALGMTKEEETYDLDVTVVGHDGEPLGEGMVTFLSESGSSGMAFIENGRFHTSLPKDTYYLSASAHFTGADGQRGLAMGAEPRLVLDADTHIELDLRRNYHPRVELADRPGAEVGDVSLGTLLMRDGMGVGSGARVSADLDHVYLRPSRTEHDGFTLSVDTSHAKPDGKGTFVNSPYLYELTHEHTGSIPGEFTRRVSDGDLGHVHSRHADGVAGWGQRGVVVGELPFELSEYYTPGVIRPLLELVDKPRWEGPAPVVATQYTAVPLELEAGETVNLLWNTAVHGPTFTHDPENGGPFRLEHGMGFPLRLYGDGGGHLGVSTTDSISTELYRDGEPVRPDEYDSGFFPVPNEPASYRFHVRAERGELTPLSRVVDAEWTFDDDGVEEGESKALPLLGVHFDTDFGVSDAPKAGKKVRLPFSVQRNGSQEEPKLTTLRFEVSFDGGKTWRPVPYNRSRDGHELAVRAPEGVKDVSLRVEAEDVDGNGLKQTIVGAYPVR
ncbi:S8 family peptidase [Saccharomonospora cyanea]|uniref:Subtilisin-like serine protease n=1 Tax=Saccharomonospora cyanea NA-134 TaxID=882082 RepID=H5XHX3_9PSEU|nr:S8 family peptidase [Saccharomonospora cyanea]EHR59579.1 subtilisin-like serine protease [Saccharomonospora cyanea NA-134]